MTRLSEAALAAADPALQRPAYDRRAVRTGVLHFGPGAFHRAHQAWHFDRLLATSPGWGVCAVSLRSPDLAEALVPQDGLYVLVEQDAVPTYRAIGAFTAVLTAPRSPGAVFAVLTSPSLKLVTSTVTEKGYCLTPAGDLDLAHPDIVHDRDRPQVPKSFPGWLVEGLRRRRSAGLAPFACVPCDNLADNGARLARAARQLAEAQGDAELAAFIAGEVVFASTMVDSITPATDAALKAQVEAATGLADAWPVQRERFVQWVVEDRLGALGAELAGVGVTLTHDVAGFERAKLRLLNGAHSTLAYAGLLKGHATVREAMADPDLAGFVEAMMRQDIAPSVGEVPGLDLAAYVSAILERFRNPAIVHRLAQIAWDGSQKLPFRILATAAEALAAGRPVERLAVPVAAWMRFIERRAAERAEIVDPLAAVLAQTRGVEAFLALRQVFPEVLASDPRWRAAVTAAYERLG